MYYTIWPEAKVTSLNPTTINNYDKGRRETSSETFLLRKPLVCCDTDGYCLDAHWFQQITDHVVFGIHHHFLTVCWGIIRLNVKYLLLCTKQEVITDKSLGLCAYPHENERMKLQGERKRRQTDRVIFILHRLSDSGRRFTSAVLRSDRSSFKRFMSSFLMCLGDCPISSLTYNVCEDWQMKI